MRRNLADSQIWEGAITAVTHRYAICRSPGRSLPPAAALRGHSAQLVFLDLSR
jgi:hypothetical protein